MNEDDVLTKILSLLQAFDNRLSRQEQLTNLILKTYDDMVEEDLFRGKWEKDPTFTALKPKLSKIKGEDVDIIGVMLNSLKQKKAEGGVVEGSEDQYIKWMLTDALEKLESIETHDPEVQEAVEEVKDIIEETLPEVDPTNSAVPDDPESHKGPDNVPEGAHIADIPGEEEVVTANLRANDADPDDDEDEDYDELIKSDKTSKIIS